MTDEIIPLQNSNFSSNTLDNDKNETKLNSRDNENLDVDEKVSKKFDNKNYDDIDKLTNNDKISFKSKKTYGGKLFDEIVEEIGYGKEQWIIIFVSGLNFMLQGIYFFLNSAMFIPVQKYYNVNNAQMSIASSMVYASGIFSSLIIGYLTNNGRLKVVYITTIIICFSHIGICMSKSFSAYCFYLFIIGGMLNINGPILTNILTEFLPVKYRAFSLGTVWSWYSLGNVFLLLIYLFYMPTYDEYKCYVLFWILLAFPLITLLITFFFLKNSPRSMICSDKEKEGFKLFSEMYSNTPHFKQLNRNEVFTDSERQQIISEVIANGDGELDHHENLGLKDLFDSKYSKLTILLMILWVMNSLIGYGPYFVMPLTLNKLNQVEDNSENNEEAHVIKSQLVISLIGIFANPIGGFMCEMESLGRKNTASLSSLLIFVMCTVLIFDFKNLVFYLSLLNVLNTLTFNTTITYTSEVYPTKLRDYSSGYLNSLGNFGAMVSQPLYIFFNYCGLKIPYLATSIFGAISVISFYFLPFETRGMELDFK